MDRALSAGIDRLRALSIVGVVCIHATSPFINARAADSPHDVRFWGLVLLNQAARFSVPAFFVLAGLLTGSSAHERLLGDAGPGRYLRARLLRLLLPYVSWSVVFWFLPAWLGSGSAPPHLTTNLLLGRTFTGGYFLIALAQIVPMAPLLCRWSAARPGAAAAATAVLMTLITAEVMTASYGGGTASSRLLRSLFSAALSLGIVWAPFFMAGLLAGLHPATLRRTLLLCRPWLRALGAAGFALSLFEFRVILAGTASAGIAAGFLKPSSIVFAASVTGFVLGGSVRRPPSRLVVLLAPASFAIYLVHGGVLQIASRLAPDPSAPALAIGVGVTAMLATGLLVPLVLHRTVAPRLPVPLRAAFFGRA